MKTRANVLFYRISDGVFTGLRFTGPSSNLPSNTPQNCAAIDAELVADWQAQRVNLETGAVEDWQPPAPPADAWRTWSWDATARRWFEQPTTAARWRDVRAERDRRIAATDWIALRGLERGEPIPHTWKDYRQALRDITTQPDPAAITWPTPPPA